MKREVCAKREESVVTLLRTEKTSRPANPLLEWVSGAREVLKEEVFRRSIAIERKRTERSQKPFLLTLFEVSDQQGSENMGRILDKMVSALLNCTRETDVIGWYTNRTTVGVLFTDIVASDRNSILSVILSKVSTTLRDELTPDQFARVSISFHFFPDHWDHDRSCPPSNHALYPDLFGFDKGKRSLLGIKRAMDIAGSGLMLTLSAPLFLVIAAVVKASSTGPVFFRQQRVGQYGQQFTFLKFRSMHVNNDPSAHKAFVTEFITSQTQAGVSNGNGEPIYKLPNDKRVTRVGKFLRKTSLDELPQFLNVLKGEMALVGPRPPIPYELAAYQTWHRRRVLEVKPGITGLWQVTGRSRVKFDEMVRLDLRYAASWSPWLDAKILMRTPMAVIKGTGAY
jgi:lipopolysaccharide/colanic/teichoic acid biosynthesis glycosyltransferase